jgi:hypothetical protein
MTDRQHPGRTHALAATRSVLIRSVRVEPEVAGRAYYSS